ncbi:MAG: trigger factor [Thermodesulfobacteriota bacterium]
MKIEIEEISPVEKKFSVTLPKELVTSELNSAYEDLRRKAKVKGFRQGRVPRSILERYYKREVEGEVIIKLVNDSYFKILEEKNITPVSQPLIDNNVLEIGKEFTYSAKVEVKPEIDVRGYIGIELEKGKINISEEDIDKKLAELQRSNAQLREVEESRPIKVGDFVVIDYEGFWDVKAIDGEKVADHLLEVGSGSFSPDFEEQLPGLKKGDERNIQITLPEEYSKKDLAGKEVTFKVKIKGIKEKILPELNDDFAKDLGEFETLEKLKQKIRENLERLDKIRIEANLRDQLLNKLVEVNAFEVPPSLVNQHLQDKIKETQMRLSLQGVSMEQVGISANSIRESYKDQAEKEVKVGFLLEEIAKKESIEVDERYIEDKILEIAENSGHNVEVVRNHYKGDEARERLKSGLKTEKTLDFIIEKANIKEIERRKNDTDSNSD